MSKSSPTLRFDHREIAVIFSLFIFVSLLMFTVGILVGKGLAQAKYEGVLLHLPTNAAGSGETESASGEAPLLPPSSGTSVSTDAPAAKTVEAKETKTAKADEHGAGEKNEATKESAKTETANSETPNPQVANGETAKAADKTAPLVLVPKVSKTDNLAGTSLREPVKSPEADELMKNPKLRALVDNEKPDAAGPTAGDKPIAKRAAASAPARAAEAKPAAKGGEVAEQSLAVGPFTVQVGSYPTDKDAAERVEALKKLGFSHAYFSAKQWSDTKETWYRVWLGYYPDYESAKRSGRSLQERGEVTNYLVRKTDAAK